MSCYTLPAGVPKPRILMRASAGYYICHVPKLCFATGNTAFQAWWNFVNGVMR